MRHDINPKMAFSKPLMQGGYQLESRHEANSMISSSGVFFGGQGGWEGAPTLVSRVEGAGNTAAKRIFELKYN